jgi:hypothetical protein
VIRKYLRLAALSVLVTLPIGAQSAPIEVAFSPDRGAIELVGEYHCGGQTIRPRRGVFLHL